MDRKNISMTSLSRNTHNKIVPALLIVAFTFLSGVSLYYINKLQGHARVINYTGIVRGATQQLVKQELHHVCDDLLIMRLDGIISELSSGKGKNNLIRLDDPHYQNLLKELQVYWEKIKTEIHRVRNGGDTQTLYDLSEKVFKIADQAVSASEEYSEKIVYRTWSWLIGLNLAFVILVLLVYHLTSRQRKLSEELQFAENASREKSEFLSKMSHEIRTPMNGIIGMTRIAKMSVDNREKLEDSLNKLDMSSHFLLALINDILDMARIESGKVELYEKEFNLLHMLEGIEIMFLQKAADNKVDFRVIKTGLSGQTVIGDELRITQIIINMVSNALKFTPAGGKVTLEIRQTPVNNTHADIEIVISDSGIGMTEEFMKRMFIPFEQEKQIVKQYGGTGLGLAICQNLVKMMHGRISVTSRPGEGSTFTINLTLKQTGNQNPASGSTNVNNRENMPALPEGCRIMLAEDNEINAEIVIAMLESTGILIDHVWDGQEVIDKYNASPDGFYDLILMDVQMPRIDGLEATRTIRASSRQDAQTIPIIALTANAFRQDMENALDSGMNDYLSKPIDPDKLIRLIASSVDKNTDSSISGGNHSIRE